MTSATYHKPITEIRIVTITLTVLGLGVLSVVTLGVLAGRHIFDAIAATDRAPERLRDNTQMEMAIKLESKTLYTDSWQLTLRSGATSGAAVIRGGLAEREGLTEAAHLWLALDALGRQNAPLAQAHFQAAEEARGREANPKAQRVREGIAGLRGWAAIPASRAQDLARWNETVGRNLGDEQL